MDIKEALTAYTEDLRYQIGCGVDTLNFCTSGTPSFEDLEEAIAYLKEVRTSLLSHEELVKEFLDLMSITGCEHEKKLLLCDKYNRRKKERRR